MYTVTKIFRNLETPLEIVCQSQNYKCYSTTFFPTASAVPYSVHFSKTEPAQQTSDKKPKQNQTKLQNQIIYNNFSITFQST